MTTVAVPAYHFGILKGYLLGQNAPAEVLIAAEALHVAAVQGPLRDDALEAIRMVTEAAEKLMARAETRPHEPGLDEFAEPAETLGIEPSRSNLLPEPRRYWTR